MGDKMKKYYDKYKILFFLCLILQLLCALYFCSLKQGFFIDEGFTYILSNSYMNPFLNDDPDFLNSWHSLSYFRDALTVQQGERISLESVYYNQSQDVHPPLYYILIHLLCGMRVGIFSKWNGLILNIAIYMCLLTFIYKLLGICVEDKLIQATGGVIYGLSVGAISNVILIRMYMLLTLLVVMSLYYHVLLIIYPCNRNKYYKIIFGVTLLGLLTQYYYMIYQFFLVLTVVFLLFRKERKLRNVIDYLICEGIAGCIFILIWPYAFSQVLGKNGNNTYRGQEAFSNMVSSGVGERIKTIFVYLNRELFGGYGLIAVVIIILLLIWGRDKKQINENGTINKIDNIKKDVLLMVVTPAVLYLLLVSKIAPDMFMNQQRIGSRYIWPVYPFILISVIILFDYSRSKGRIKYLAILVLCAIQLLGLHQKNSMIDILLHSEVETIVEDTMDANKTILVSNGTFCYVDIMEIIGQSTSLEVGCVTPDYFFEFLKDSKQILEGHKCVLIFSSDLGGDYDSASIVSEISDEYTYYGWKGGNIYKVSF